MTRHKHADVLIAIAEGKEVQYIYSDSAVWNDMDNSGYDPFKFPYHGWRIKPEPRPDVVLYQGLDSINGERGCYFNSSIGLGHWDYIIKWVEDGETGKPKSVELIK